MATLGRQIVAEYYDCNPDILNDVAAIETCMLDAAKAAEATVINSTFHHFSPFGVSGVVVIQESHLAIHTWPEYGYAAVDIFTCGNEVDPWISYKFLEKAFEADYASAMEMLRGQTGQMKKAEIAADDQGRPEAQPTIQHNRNVWFTERNEQIAMSLRHKGDRLFGQQSDFQKVEIFDTYAYGKLLTLDGMVMTTEKDEYVYHEMISHVAMQSLSDPKRALVIGGGDGGVIREILRYESIEQVVMVEIDGMVVEASKEFLPSIASEFDNPKLDLRIADGIEYVQKVADETFDLVIVDSTDPVGPGEGLFKAAFYQDVYRILTKDGVMITQSESPRFNTKVFQEIFACYRDIFGKDHVHCYLAHIPTYPTGMWSFSFSSKSGVNPLKAFNADKAESFTQKHGLQYYNAAIHSASFALPGYVKTLLE
jgi:spermidine synthase